MSYYCPICLCTDTDIDKLYVLECNHCFHYKCLFPFYRNQINDFGKGFCPLCRKSYIYYDGYSYDEINNTLINMYNIYYDLYCNNSHKNLLHTINKNKFFKILMEEFKNKYKGDINIYLNKLVIYNYNSLSIICDLFVDV